MVLHRTAEILSGVEKALKKQELDNHVKVEETKVDANDQNEVAEVPKHPFFIFVEECYEQPALSAVLQQLQTTNTVSVNVLLYVIWSAIAEQRRLRHQDLLLLEKKIQSWHQQVIRALVRLDQRLGDKKEGTLALSKAVIADLRHWVQVEIKHANRVEQALLISALGLDAVPKKATRSKEQRLKDICNNAVHYYKLKRLGMNIVGGESLVQLVTAVCDDYSADQVCEGLELSITQAKLKKIDFRQLPLTGL